MRGDRQAAYSAVPLEDVLRAVWLRDGSCDKSERVVLAPALSLCAEPVLGRYCPSLRLLAGNVGVSVALARAKLALKVWSNCGRRTAERLGAPPPKKIETPDVSHQMPGVPGYTAAQTCDLQDAPRKPGWL